MQKLYKFKGTVETLNELSIIENRNIGDVYKCNENSNDYIWNGQEWINIGQNSDYSEILLEDIEKYKESISKTYKGSNITAPTIEGFGKIKKLYGKAGGIGNSGSIEITSKNGDETSLKIIELPIPLKETDYIDFVEQKVLHTDRAGGYDLDCTCEIVQYEEETIIYNSDNAEMEIELTNSKAISSINSNITKLQEKKIEINKYIDQEVERLNNKKVSKDGDRINGIFEFANKKEFEAIRKIRTIDNVDYIAKLGIGASKSVSLELSADGQTLGRLDIMADGTIKNYKTGNLLVEEGKWITATLNSGVKATDSGLGGCKGIKYRKIGNHVFVIGSVSTTYDGTNQVVLTTLPEGYRPKFLNYTFCPLTGSNIARIYIANDGRLVLEWVKSIANGNNVTNELSWVSTKIDFFVD